jgi:hypothetical protein
MRITVKVKPNSRINEFREISKDYFEAKVTVPPEKGRANQKVIELISKYFKVPKSNITLISGEAFKVKVFVIGV